MTDWVGFVGFTGVVVTLMLALAWVSRDAIEVDSATAERQHEEAVQEFNRVMGGPAPGPGEPRPQERRRDSGGDAETVDESASTASASATAETRAVDQNQSPTATDADPPLETDTGPSVETGSEPQSPAEPHKKRPDASELSTGTLLANVVITQGLFFGLLVIGLWWTDVPAVAMGLEPAGTVVPGVETTSLGWSPTAITLGIALGAGLYVFNQIGAELGNRIGIDSSTALREALAPASIDGWAGLLGVVLPVVAAFEELLFRGALIGGLALASIELGAAVSPWLLVLGSAVAFALGHGAQGRGGIVVTGTLGVVLGAAFVLTWSLPLVIVAHYVVNALEFVIHEGLDMDWI